MINRRITNLAGGVNPTDAVNMSQLDVVTKAIGMSEDEIKNIEKDPSKSVVARINEEKKPEQVQSMKRKDSVNKVI
ncbi:hypothetical protein I3679_000615 [Proteus mirabilis]|uniref:Trimeric autotransporter adhesin YadA-like stalk domain-containing protein n=1 Tax=Proteus mirabilis TaxID=584 RepID=A0ABD5LS36_PROMI